MYATPPVPPPQTEILNNPFNDILPRAHIRRKGADGGVKKPKKKSRVRAVKDFKLMSFGEEAEEEESTALAVDAKIKSSHALLHEDKRLAGAAATPGLPATEEASGAPSGCV